MDREWNVHYFRWVIDDGEPELHVGDVFDWFAITFWSDSPLFRSTEATKTAVPVADGRYRVNAEVTYISQDLEQAACIIDFGIKAISEIGRLFGIPLPPGCREGDYVMGEVRLQLPLCTTIHPHDLKHHWRVNSVLADLTPYLEDPADPKLGRRSSQVVYEDVASTESVKAWSYLLQCSDVDAD